MCYFFSCKINLSQLLSYLQYQDQLLFDLYSQRMNDYVTLILGVLEIYLNKIDAKLQ